MFRRRWSGLPADPIFASDLKELGYFVNDIDEIRSIENPDYYFKYFLTKNERWNERQRFAFNDAVRKEIHARLDALNFATIPLPLNTPPTQPHVPIRTTPNLASAPRAVVLFHESSQSLGVLAHRVIGGAGGVSRGSVVGLAAAVGKLQCGGGGGDGDGDGGGSPPGFVLANAGELWWWPEGGRGLTPVERHRVPMASAVHLGRYHDPRVNEVPGHRTVAEHVRGVFEALVDGGLVNGGAKLDVIAVGDTADEVEKYLDDDEVWAKTGARLGCLVILGGSYSSKNFKCEGFKQFMKERARAYMIHHTPLDTPIAGPGGNPGAAGFTSFGCPVFSAGNAQVTETIPIETQSTVLKWVQQVALQGEAYKNEIVEIFGENDSGIAAEDDPWGTPQADGNDDDGSEGQANNTEVADGKAKGSVGKAKAIEVNDEASEITLSKDTAQAKVIGTETADGKTKGRGDEAQTIEADGEAIRKSMKAVRKDIKATDKKIKAIGANIKAMDRNTNPTEEDIKSMKATVKAAEENIKAVKEKMKATDEYMNAIEESIKAIEENDKAEAAAQAQKAAAEANSTSTEAISTQAAGSNTKTDNKVVSAKSNDMVETGGVETHSENTPFLPTDGGPNAEDMKELVTEMKDLTVTH